MHLLNDKTKNTMRIKALQVMYRLSIQIVRSWRKSSESKNPDCNSWKLLLSLLVSCQISRPNVVRVLKFMTALSESEAVPRPDHEDTNGGKHNSQSYLCTRGEARA